MKYKLTFSKAFGIEFMPVDYFPFFLIFKDKEYQVLQGNDVVNIRMGNYGTSEAEKKIISAFYHSDDRILEKIPLIPTLDVSFDVELALLEDCSPCDEKVDSDELIKPYIHEAVIAVGRFIDAYNSMMHLNTRSRSEWKDQRPYLIPEITEMNLERIFFTICNPPRNLVLAA